MFLARGSNLIIQLHSFMLNTCIVHTSTYLTCVFFVCPSLGCQDIHSMSQGGADNLRLAHIRLGMGCKANPPALVAESQGACSYADRVCKKRHFSKRKRCSIQCNHRIKSENNWVELL